MYMYKILNGKNYENTIKLYQKNYVSGIYYVLKN